MYACCTLEWPFTRNARWNNGWPKRRVQIALQAQSVQPPASKTNMTNGKWQISRKQYWLLSPISKLCSTRTPCMHDSSTWAPCAPIAFPLRSRWRPAVDSLNARPSSRFLSASNGSLHNEMFKCFRLSELVKNCLYDGGVSLPFLVLNELCETFRWLRWVEQPRNNAPNSCGFANGHNGPMVYWLC